MVPITAVKDRALIDAHASDINCDEPCRSANTGFDPTGVIVLILTRRSSVDARQSVFVEAAVAHFRMYKIFDR